MRKIVSRNDGVTLFFEKRKDIIDCIAYETGKHMSGQEIGEKFNISRARVSQILKKSIKRIFYSIKIKNSDLNIIQIIIMMAEFFNIKNQTDYKKFLRLFPKNIQGEIYEEAERYYKN